MTFDRVWLEQQLIDHEDLRLKLYKCPAGKWTIGVGRNLEDRGISKDEAMYLLRNDIDISYNECLRNIEGFKTLCTPRKGVLVNMMFNLGWTRLRSFRKCLTAVAIGDFDEASVQMLDSKWALQVGHRAIELARTMKTGVHE